jgi:GrpB protein
VAYHHLYLVVANSPAHRDHLDLRDYLRTHPTECERYAQMKRELAPLLVTERNAYVTGKADLVTELLRLARIKPANACRGHGPLMHNRSSPDLTSGAPSGEELR